MALLQVWIVVIEENTVNSKMVALTAYSWKILNYHLSRNEAHVPGKPQFDRIWTV